MGRPRGRKGLTLGGRADAEGVGVGEESCLGGKASWGWAAEKGAANSLEVVGLEWPACYIHTLIWDF